MDPGTQADLSVEDRFFLRIATKNQLLDESQVARAAEAVRRLGSPVSQIVVQLGLLDSQQVERIREAMAASQVMRLDSIFAELLLEEGLISRPVLDQAFLEQRRQGYRARIGNILVQARKLSPDNHRRLITQVIQRLRTDGLSGSGLGATPPAPPQPPPRPRPTPPSSGAHGLFNDSDESEPLFGSYEAQTPAPQEDEPFRIPLSETMESPPSMFKDSALFHSSGAVDGLTESAVRISLDGEGFDIEADQAMLRSDLDDSVERWAEGKSESFVLERGELQEDAQSFVPEEYVRRRRVRARILGLALGSLAVGVCAIAGILGSHVYANRARLDQARDLLADAKEADPHKRAELLIQAKALLEDGATLGVSERDREAILEEIAWANLETSVERALSAEQPAAALSALEDAPEALRTARADDFAALRTHVERSGHLSAARALQASGDWAAAVARFRDASSLGDPGGVAEDALLDIRQTLLNKLKEAERLAEQRPSRKHENEFRRLGKVIVEIFREDPLGVDKKARELRYQRIRSEAIQLARRDERSKALPRLRRLLEEREDPELRRLLQDLERRGELDRLRREARQAEGAGDFNLAIEKWKAASELGTQAQRKTFAVAIEGCKTKLLRASQRAAHAQALRENVARVRASKIDDALEAMESFVAKDPSAEARLGPLLKFCKRVRGTVFVPKGTRLMGTAAGQKGDEHERPQHPVTLECFFVGRTEVTNEQYREFLNSTPQAPVPKSWTTPRRFPDGRVEGMTFASDLGSHPVVQVTHAQASAYAAWRGGALPSEQQWEAAARGAEGQLYPWGAERPPGQVRAHVQSDRTRLRRAPTVPVATQADDKSPYGAYDLGGNVQEWTRTVYASYPGGKPVKRTEDTRYVIRGGAFRWPWKDARCAFRDRASPSYSAAHLGFRIVIEPPPEVRALLDAP